MIARCTDQDHDSFEEYGGRGITVCERWLKSFTDFLSDVGKRPSESHSLDRIETNGNYEPGNVRWATKSQQNRNLRTNALLVLDGKSATAAEWSEITGISPITIATRKRRGWTDERTLTTPAMKKSAMA